MHTQNEMEGQTQRETQTRELGRERERKARGNTEKGRDKVRRERDS